MTAIHAGEGVLTAYGAVFSISKWPVHRGLKAWLTGAIHSVTWPSEAVPEAQWWRGQVALERIGETAQVCRRTLTRWKAPLVSTGLVSHHPVPADIGVYRQAWMLSIDPVALEHLVKLGKDEWATDPLAKQLSSWEPAKTREEQGERAAKRQAKRYRQLGYSRADEDARVALLEDRIGPYWLVKTNGTQAKLRLVARASLRDAQSLDDFTADVEVVAEAIELLYRAYRGDVELSLEVGEALSDLATALRSRRRLWHHACWWDRVADARRGVELQRGREAQPSDQGFFKTLGLHMTELRGALASGHTLADVQLAHAELLRRLAVGRDAVQMTPSTTEPGLVEVLCASHELATRAYDALAEVTSEIDGVGSWFVQYDPRRATRKA